MNYCEHNPGLCQNGAKCVSLTKEDGNFRCMCREGTYGRNCEFSEYTTTTSKAPIENASTVIATNVTTVSEAIASTTTETGVKNPAETENETN